LDTKRRNSGCGDRIYPRDNALKRCSSAPTAKQNGRAGFDGNSVRRQKIDNNLKIGLDVANLENGRASNNHRPSSLIDLKNLPFSRSDDHLFSQAWHRGGDPRNPLPFADCIT